MKSFSLVVMLALIASASCFVTPAGQQIRPTSSSRLFLCPDDAKDLEAVACIQYEYQQMMREATENTNYNMHHQEQRHGPVAWYRRLFYNLTRKQDSSSSALRP